MVPSRRKMSQYLLNVKTIKKKMMITLKIAATPIKGVITRKREAENRRTRRRSRRSKNVSTIK